MVGDYYTVNEKNISNNDLQTEVAHTKVALSITFFCKATWNAIALILKNIVRFRQLLTIGLVLNWFGICMVSDLNDFGAYIAITKIE